MITAKLAHSLKLVNDKEIAQCTNSKLVANYRFRFSIILLLLSLVLLYCIILSPYIPFIEQYNMAGLTVMLICGLVAFLFLSSTNMNWTNIVTKDSQNLNKYEYRLDKMYLFLIQERYISPKKDNQYFYLSVLNSLKDRIKPSKVIDMSVHAGIVAVILAVLSFIFVDVQGINNKLLIIHSTLIIYLTAVTIYVLFLFFDKRNSLNYNLLNTIINDLLIQDSIKQNRKK